MADRPAIGDSDPLGLGIRLVTNRKAMAAALFFLAYCRHAKTRLPGEAPSGGVTRGRAVSRTPLPASA